MDQAPKMSPMHTSCYGDEDMVALMHLLGLVSARVCVCVCVRVCVHMSLAYLGPNPTSLTFPHQGGKGKAICFDGEWTALGSTGLDEMGGIRLCEVVAPSRVI